MSNFWPIFIFFSSYCPFFTFEPLPLRNSLHVPVAELLSQLYSRLLYSPMTAFPFQQLHHHIYWWHHHCLYFISDEWGIQEVLDVSKTMEIIFGQLTHYFGTRFDLSIIYMIFPQKLWLNNNKKDRCNFLHWDKLSQHCAHFLFFL